MKIMKSFGVLALVSLPLAAEASSVTLNINSITGVWTAANGAPMTTEGIGTNTLSWGVPFPDPAGNPSSYVFDPRVTPFSEAPNTVFDLGKFTHNNFEIIPPSITDATLKVTIDGTFANGGSENFSLMSFFVFDHLETPNIAPCDPGGATICPDVVTPTLNLGASTSVMIAGVEYVLNVTGFNMGASFITEEEAMNMAILQASFVERSSLIPIPATLPLLMAAIGALAFAARCRA